MSHVSINIIRVGLEDAEEVRDISILTFRETFEESNSPENMEAYIRESRSPEIVAAELSVADSETYFAKLPDGTIAGYLKINRKAAQVEPMPDSFMEVERIYILKEHHGKKIGSKLMEFVFQKALAEHMSTVWLGVWEHNYKAIAFYRQLGFVDFDRHSFFVGNDEQTDIMMKKELR